MSTRMSVLLAVWSIIMFVCIHVHQLIYLPVSLTLHSFLLSVVYPILT